MYMRFRMQIESVMKEVTFRAELRARAKVTRGLARSRRGRELESRVGLGLVGCQGVSEDQGVAGAYSTTLDLWV